MSERRQGIGEENALLRARWGPDADLQEIADGIHGLGQTGLCRFLCPEEGFSVGLREHARGADEIPGREGEAGVTMILLCGDVL